MATNQEILAKSTEAAQAAAKSIGGTFTQGGGFTAGTTKTSGGQDAFLQSLQEKLLGQADLISSTSTGLETKIEEAIGGVQKAGELTRAATESAATREIEFAKEQFGQQRETMLEGRRGFATNQAALTQLDVRTEKSVRDLEQRKQELLMQGDAATASKVSELQFKALEFQQKAAQDTFNNILGAGQFAAGLKGIQLQEKQEARLASAQEYEQSFNEAKFAFTQATTLEEQRQGQVRINIMNAELKLKQAESGVGLDPDPGFDSVSTQNQVGQQANQKLGLIQSRIDSGEIDEFEAEAETVKSYLDLRRTLAESQVSDDALAQTLGMTIDPDGELGFITGDVSGVRLPGEKESPLGVPALGVARFLFGILEKPGEFTAEFLTGKKPEGFVK